MVSTDFGGLLLKTHYFQLVHPGKKDSYCSETAEESAVMPHWDNHQEKDVLYFPSFK